MSIKLAIFLGTILGLMVGIPLAITTIDATGGAGQIAEMVMSKLNDAQLYLNEGDVKAAQEEIQNAINELKDTYEADQQEEH